MKVGTRVEIGGAWMGSEVGFWPGVEAGVAYVPRCMQGVEWQIYVGVEWNLPRLHVARQTANQESMVRITGIAAGWFFEVASYYGSTGCGDWSL